MPTTLWLNYLHIVCYGLVQVSCLVFKVSESQLERSRDNEFMGNAISDATVSILAIASDIQSHYRKYIGSHDIAASVLPSTFT